jgi:hypothetical protein
MNDSHSAVDQFTGSGQVRPEALQAARLKTVLRERLGVQLESESSQSLRATQRVAAEWRNMCGPTLNPRSTVTRSNNFFTL